MNNLKIRILKKEKSYWWRAIKVKGEWVQVKTVIHIGNDVCSRFFAVELADGTHMSRGDFNLHECIEGNDYCGFKVYKPSYIW